MNPRYQPGSCDCPAAVRCSRNAAVAPGRLGFSTVVIPFPTATLAAAFAGGNRNDERVAVALYALSATPLPVPWLIMFRYLGRHPELRAPGISDGYLRAQL